MKILSILLSNALLVSNAPSVINTKKVNTFVAAATQENMKKNPFVEVAFNLEDYLYFQEDNNVESIIDYIINSKKITNDKLIGKNDEAQIKEILPASITGSVLSKTKSLLDFAIVKSISTIAHDSYKSEVEEISTKSSSSGGGSSSSSSGNSFGSLSDWKASNDGQDKLAAYIADQSKKSQIVEGWKTVTGAHGLNAKAQTWMADANFGQAAKSKAEWFWTGAFLDTFSAWVTSVDNTEFTNDIIKPSWYFSDHYFQFAANAGNRRHPDKTDADLDTWLATPEGIEAVRYFAVNAAHKADAKSFFDYWKANGDNYLNSSNAWMDDLNTKQDGTKKVKPNRNVWLSNGHAAWDTFKVWVENSAIDQAHILGSMAEETSFVVPDGFAKSDFKNTQGVGSVFDTWWGNQQPIERAKMVRFHYRKTADGQARVRNWLSTGPKKIKDDWGSVNNVSAANKMSYSHGLTRLFREYIKLVDNVGVADINKWNITDLLNGRGQAKATWDALLAEANGAQDDSDPKNVKAREFKNFYENNYFAFDARVWDGSWYIIDRSDLNWSNPAHRYFWYASANKTKANMVAYINANGYVANNPALLNAFKKTPKYQSWKARNEAMGNSSSDNAALIQATSDLASNLDWVYYDALISNDTSPAPAAFTTWKNAFNGVYTTDINGDGITYYDAYANALSASEKKDSGWSTFIAAQAGKDAYGNWLATQSTYKNAVKDKLLKDYETLGIKYYNNSSQSETDYSDWNPWYMNKDLFDDYARYGLKISQDLITPNSPYYIRFMFAKFKEQDLWRTDYDPLTDPKRFSRLWVAYRNPFVQNDLLIPLNWSNIPVDKINELDTLDNGGPDWTLRPEYQGGYFQRQAYKKDENHFGSLSTADKWSAVDGVRSTSAKDYILWDSLSRVTQWLQKHHTNMYHKHSFFRTNLIKTKWQKAFEKSSLEAYYAYRDKFIDNSNTTRAKVIPFSDAVITAQAQALTTAQKQQIYVNSRLMTDDALLVTRQTAFNWWTDSAPKRYQPILKEQFLNDDSLNENAFDEWTPRRLFNEDHYAELAKATIAGLTPTAADSASKQALQLSLANIPLVKYYLKTIAQAQFLGESVNFKDSTQKNGKKFLATLYDSTSFNKTWDYWSSIKAFDHYYDKFNPFSRTVYRDAWYDSKFAMVVNNWVDSEFVYYEAFWALNKMMENDKIDFDSGYISDKTKIRVSEEIINKDKTIARNPADTFNDYVANHKDAIWDNAFIKDTANYQADYNAWKNSL